MPIKIDIELSDQDIKMFAEMASRARNEMDPSVGRDEIFAAAKELMLEAKKLDAPEFIENRLSRLNFLMDMVGDKDWALPEDDAQRVLIAMAYFADPDDLIEDSIPCIGFLDDAIMVELAFEGLKPEVMAYMEFSAFRNSEERRLKKEGVSTDDRDKWLGEKRAALHARMKEDQGKLFESGAWRVSR